MKKTLFKLLRFSGLPYLLRELVQREKISIVILHDPSPETAEKCFKYLKKHYSLIHLDELIHGLENNKKHKFPSKSMIITFDDGHIGNYDLMDKIEEYNVPLTIFVCSAIIGTKRGFWFNENYSSSFKKNLKIVSNKKRLDLLKDKGFYQTNNGDKATALQEDHILKMRNTVNFQSHGRFHPIFTNCSTEEIEKEIFESKRDLEENFNFNIDAIAYPNGNYSSREKLLVKKAGYKCALTIDFGYNSLTHDPFMLKRIGISDSANLDEIIVKSSGLWDILTMSNFRFIRKLKK